MEYQKKLLTDQVDYSKIMALDWEHDGQNWKCLKSIRDSLRWEVSKLFHKGDKLVNILGFVSHIISVGTKL